MKIDELQNKNSQELQQLLGELRAKLLKFNFDLVDNKLKDVSQIKKTKKDIARIMTTLKNLYKQHGTI